MVFLALFQGVVAFLALSINFFFWPVVSLAAEKIVYATPSEAEPYHLPALAAQDLGIWKRYGLDVDWRMVRGAGLVNRAVAAGQIDAGSQLSLGTVAGMGRGVPFKMVMHVGDTDYFIWVKTKSHFTRPQDLKGAKLSVTSLGGGIHAYGVAMATALGMEKEIKFVATGGFRESLAAFLRGSVDGMVMSLRIMLKLKMRGEARELVRAEDYLPREFPVHTVYASNDFLKKNREMVLRLSQAMLETITFLATNQAWTINKLKTDFNRSEEEAKLILGNDPRFSRDGKLTYQGVKNLREFALRYGLAEEKGMPPVEGMFEPLL